jgi:uncharacterized protein (DUF488 family)
VSATDESAHALFTIGHSNHELTGFIALLREHDVRLVCDVRSRPQSFRFPHFDEECLRRSLSDSGIRYEFLGEELGGRPADPKLYRPDGRVDYAACRRSYGFRRGLERLLDLNRVCSLALMCAEEDPLECHRFLMICPALAAAGIIPLHIRRSGDVEGQREAEDRLLELQGFHDVTSDALFAVDRETALEEAIRKQSALAAFRAAPETIEYL